MPETMRLTDALRRCRTAFRSVAATVDTADPLQSDVSRLRDRWNAHYFGPFRELDRALRTAARRGDAAVHALIPVSISHHNLHRLMEVLERDTAGRALAEGNIPERVLDLAEACARLTALLEEPATAPTPATSFNGADHER